MIFAAAAACSVSQAFASERAHAAYLASVATYKPMAGFNHVVGATRFVGYFLQAPDACRLIVFEAAADDEALASPPRRIEISIRAGDRSAFGAGDGSALAIACTADADAIKVVPQTLGGGELGGSLSSRSSGRERASPDRRCGERRSGVDGQGASGLVGRDPLLKRGDMLGLLLDEGFRQRADLGILGRVAHGFIEAQARRLRVERDGERLARPTNGSAAQIEAVSGLSRSGQTKSVGFRAGMSR